MGKEKEKRKSPKPNRRSLAESTSRHASPKHEPKGAEAHGKKGWSKDSTDGIPRTSRGTSTQHERPYKSQVSGKAKGPNPSLRKGVSNRTGTRTIEQMRTASLRTTRANSMHIG